MGWIAPGAKAAALPMRHRRAGAAALPAISRAELRWLGLFVLALILITQIPPTVERLAGPSDRVHVGTYLYVQDFTYYLAAMREGGASDSWLVHNHFSAEPHAPAFMFPLYVGMGKLSNATGLPLLGIYAATELLGRVALAFGLYLFVASFLVGTRFRRVAYVLAMLGGGLAIWERGIEVILGLPALLGLKAAMEYITFTTMFLAPHLTLGYTALLLAVVWFSRACRGSRLALWLLAVDVVLLSLLNSFSLPVLLAAFGVYGVVRTVQQRRLATETILPGLVAGIAAAPVLVYNFVVFTFDPFWGAAYAGLRVMSEPRPWDLPVDYGVTFLLALVALIALWKDKRHLTGVGERVSGDLTEGEEGAKPSPPPWRGRGREGGDSPPAVSPEIRAAWGEPFADRILILTWIGVILVLANTPVSYQNRFLLGLQPCLAIYAALGWALTAGALARRLERRGFSAGRALIVARRATSYVTFTLAAGMIGVVLVSVVITAMSDAPSSIYRADRDTYQLGQWLAAHTDAEDVVVSGPTTGNVLAGMLAGRVVAGHPVAVHYDAKVAALTALYQGQLSEAETRSFLAANRASYLLVGPEERAIGSFDPGAQLHLPVAMRVGNVVAYAIPKAKS